MRFTKNSRQIDGFFVAETLSVATNFRLSHEYPFVKFPQCLSAFFNVDNPRSNRYDLINDKVSSLYEIMRGGKAVNGRKHCHTSDSLDKADGWCNG